jgi:beta-glucanase (GH16 family)
LRVSVFDSAVVLGCAFVLGCSAATPDSTDSAGGANAAAGATTTGAGGSAGNVADSSGSAGNLAAGGSGGTQVESSAGASTGGAGFAGASSGVAGGGSNAGGSGTNAGGGPALDPTDLTRWTLSWSDEFNASNGSPPDATKWAREVHGGTAGNHEAEYYTDALANSEQSDGNLVITAIKQSMDGFAYTSARLNTYMLYSAAYGRVEARAKMPTGKGLWPAFWMLGTNKFDAGVGWPNCGEIDIMEALGDSMTTNHGSLHGPGYSGGQDLTATVQLPGKPSLADDFHVYAVEWAPDSVKFFVDTTLYETRTPADIPAGTTWVYNHPFFITLNLAVGDTGSWPGPPDANTQFPAVLLVDYVRVYTAK